MYIGIVLLTSSFSSVVICMTAHPQIQRRRAHCLCKPIFAIETKLLIGCKDYLLFQGMCRDNVGLINARTSRYIFRFSAIDGSASTVLSPEFSWIASDVLPLL